MCCLKKSLLFIFGLTFASIYASNIEESLNDIALTQGYGYKTANLTLLSDFCKKLKNNTYTFDVPQFFGISSKDIQKFVKNILKNDLAQQWGNLIKSYSQKDKNWLTKAIKDKKFPEGFLAGTNAIEININKSFDDFIKNNKKNLKDLFQNIKEISILENLKTEKLMVRSTGKEDTNKLANAGGNESIANVDPETNQILMAMKIVIASYFSEKSLTQRLGAGDTSISDAPFTPILIQRMIGEIDETNLPRCGVMFTEETEGALSKYQNGKTSGITIIQCAFGHNEGVVNSIIPVDTYIVDSEGEQHAVIRPKQFRIAPKETLKLDRKDNDPAYINRPVLEPQAIAAMKQLATELETFYKKPMDVEFVIFNENGKETIYIVQARPIVHNPDQPMPSYLNFNNKTVRTMTSVHSSAIGSGGGELKFITSNNQIVIKKTINAALSEYQERNNKNEIKAILIEENAPVTSHEATTFRAELKPVICIPNNFSDVEQWTKSETLKLLVDTQQQRIVQWTGEEPFDLETFKKFDFANDGWINYPMAQCISVPIEQQKEFLAVIKKQVIEMLHKTMTPESITNVLSNFKKNATSFLRKQIYTVKTGNEKDAMASLAAITFTFYEIIKITEKNKAPDMLARIQDLNNYAIRQCDQIIKNIAIEPNSPDYLSKRLFPIHILETLLFQDHKDFEGLVGDSVIKIWHQLHEEEKGAKELSDKQEVSKLLGILGNYALTDMLTKKWKRFIADIDKQGLSWEQLKQHQKLLTSKTKILLAKPENKSKIDFSHTIRSLAKLNLLELWLHTSFADEIDKKKDLGVLNVLEKLNNDFAQANENNFLTTLTAHKQDVEKFSVDGFSDPQKFIKVWDDFKTNILSYFISEEFIDGFGKANRLGKLAATNVMIEFVTKFDTAIKAITGSNLYLVTELPEKKSFDDVKNDKNLFKQQISDKKDKIFTFHIMLEEYLNVLKKYYNFMTIHEKLDFTRESKGKKDTTKTTDIVNTNLNKILENLKKFSNKKEMLSSENFDGTSTALASSVLWYKQENRIDSHEKFFTYCHQGLLAIISRIILTCKIKEDLYPPSIKNIHDNITKMSNKYSKPFQIGQSFKKNKLELTYNLPQRSHSTFIKLIYNTQEKTCSLLFVMFGLDEDDRFYKSKDLAEIFSTLYNISHSACYKISQALEGKKTENRGSLIISWQWKSSDQLTWDNIEKIINLLLIFFDLTGNYTHPSLYDLMDDKETKKHKLTVPDISVFEKFDYIHWGIDVAIKKAFDEKNITDIRKILDVLEKLLNTQNLYAKKSTEWFKKYSKTKDFTKDFTLEKTINNILEKIVSFQNNTIQVKAKEIVEKYKALYDESSEIAQACNNFISNVVIKSSTMCTLPEALSLLKAKLLNLAQELKQTKSLQDHPGASIWNTMVKWIKNEGKHPNSETKKKLFIDDCKKYENENKKIYTHTENDGVFRIATYNVHMLSNSLNQDTFESIIQNIKKIKADVIILQEAAWKNNDEVKKIIKKFEEIGYNPKYVLFSHRSDIPYGNAIFSKHSFEIIGDKGKDNIITLNMYSDKDERKSYLSVKITLSNKKNITLWGTHLDVRDNTEKCRYKEIQELTNLIKKQDDNKNIIIAADFNAIREKDYQYKVENYVVWELIQKDFIEYLKIKDFQIPQLVHEHLKKEGFKDCFSVGGYLGPKFTVWTGKVVDFLYLKNWDLKILGCYVYYDAASDHLPVIMDIENK